MLFFKKSQSESAAPVGRGVIPAEKIRELSAKGFTEPEIIDVLRREGFSAEEIDKGLVQVLKSGVSEPRQDISFPPVAEEPVSMPTIEDFQSKSNMPAVPETTLPQEYYYPQTPPSEDYINALVGERMGEVKQWAGEFSLKTGELEKKIEQISNQINNLGQVRPNEQQLILTKIDALKMTVDDIETKLGSLERAFKETLPALIESVRALTDLVQRLKREA
ncbi:MAG TPA: hypothetical protein VJ343_01940 [archaeon]|nr:hypothetical protein [archaeon]